MKIEADLVKLRKPPSENLVLNFAIPRSLRRQGNE
jgi:hypothetical protein